MQKLFIILLCLCVGLVQAQTVNITPSSRGTATVYTSTGTDKAIKAAIAAIPKQSANIAQSTIDSIINVIYNAVNTKFIEQMKASFVIPAQLKPIQDSLAAHNKRIIELSNTDVGLITHQSEFYAEWEKYYGKRTHWDSMVAKIRPLALRGLSYYPGKSVDTLSK